MSRLAKLITPYVPDIVRLRLALAARPQSPPDKGGGISHINTHDLGGGAAKVAYKLAEGLRRTEDVKLYVRYRRSDEDWVSQLPSRSEGRADYYINRAELEGGWLDLARLEPLELLQDSHFLRSDIVHFHNLHGGYFSYSLLPLLSRERHAVWTLHDEHMLTGHCAVTLGCEGWKHGCGKCPMLSTYPSVEADRTADMRQLKEAAYRISNLHVISPSQWLAGRVKRAFPWLNDVRVIPNGIDVSIFTPMDRRAVRGMLGLPQDAFLLLYAAEMGIDTPYKGGEMVRRIVAQPKLGDIAVVTIGDRTERVSERHFQIPSISDEREMAKLYAACDMLLYPTKADNLPLVILESMACGTPVVASAIGGIPEIVTQGENGYLVTDFHDADAFMAQVTAYRQMSGAEKREVETNAVTTVRGQFSLDRMTNAYYSLYKELRINHKNGSKRIFH